ncbi:interferon-inducible GTPase 5-like [Heteronotia binoei]|uniref:interferon-inducible GTPase 5-like n=1 Tax=Heteronotia binoei TaxID=13085 RepID=UPI002930CF86|nr:interferon-inducible GTPase 5-like [Heteronotia binoei]
MGHTVTKLMINTELEKLKGALENKTLQDLSKEIKKELDSLNSITLDIAITGVSGAGKSSFVNALRGVSDYDDSAAKIGTTETTMKPKKYKHPIFPNVAIWDLPGIGTTEFKANEYLKMTDFAKYDFFIIVTAERFTENDALLSDEIQKMGKWCYLVRTKIDLSIMSEERNPYYIGEEKSLEKIREYCCENLRKAGVSNPKVFLLSSWKPNLYDFPLLQDTLKNEQDDLKRLVIIESMPAYSREALEIKKAAIEEILWKAALVSCVIDAITIPDLSLVCDFPFLLSTMEKFYKIFGLDERSLYILAKRVGKPIDELRSAIKKLPPKITIEFVQDQVKTELPKSWIRTTVAYVLWFIPLLGSLIGGAFSFVTIYFIMKKILNDVVEDAKNVLAKATDKPSRRTTMGVSISKAVIREELQKLMDDLENKSLPDVIEKNNNDLNLVKNTTLDIAITGMSGAGKSSLVNALRGMPDYGEGAAETGETQTTMERKKYPHPTFPKVTLWDLPGIGTPDFEPSKYLKKVNFKEYDFFIIVASNRFTTNDALLAHEIQKMKKKFYYVRTKADVSIESERRKPDFVEERCLEKIRIYCSDNLTKGRESVPMVFLISRWDLQMYDFPRLQETLENDLDGLKRDVLIAALPAFSKEILEKKKAAMEALIKKVALVSCAIGALPVPGLSLACDIGILVGTMTYICKVFGLDEDSLRRLANRVGKPVDVLRSAVKKSPMASQITKEFVIDMLTKSLLCGAVMAVEFVLDFVPVLGSLTGGGLSFVTTFYILKSFLHDAVEDAENVRAKATES